MQLNCELLIYYEHVEFSTNSDGNGKNCRGCGRGLREDDQNDILIEQGKNE